MKMIVFDDYEAFVNESSKTDTYAQKIKDTDREAVGHIIDELKKAGVPYESYSGILNYTTNLINELIKIHDYVFCLERMIEFDRDRAVLNEYQTMAQNAAKIKKIRRIFHNAEESEDGVEEFEDVYINDREGEQ